MFFKALFGYVGIGREWCGKNPGQYKFNNLYKGDVELHERKQEGSEIATWSMTKSKMHDEKNFKSTRNQYAILKLQLRQL